MTGGLKRTVYKSNRPVDVTNATEAEVRKLNAVIKGKRGGTKKQVSKKMQGKKLGGQKSREPLLAAPLFFVDGCVPDNMTVLLGKFLREGKGGETIVEFFKGREAKKVEDEDEGEEARPLASAIEPFAVGARVGMATDEGHVRRGTVTAKHSLQNVFIIWDDDEGKRKRKVKKKLLSVIEIEGEGGEEEEVSGGGQCCCSYDGNIP